MARKKPNTAPFGGPGIYGKAAKPGPGPGWHDDPVRHGLAAKGIKTTIQAKIVASGEEELLKKELVLLRKFHPSWDIQVEDIETEKLEKRLEKKESEADEEFLARIDRAIEYFYDVGLDYIAQEIERGNLDKAAEFLEEEESAEIVAETGPAHPIDYVKAKKILDAV